MNFDIYKRNLEAFEARYGKYKEINNNKYENKLEDCKDGFKTIKINDKYLNSKYSPQKEVKRYFKDFSLEYGTIIVYFGFGLSYYIFELLNKISISDEIIVYENDKELFDLVIKNIDIYDILKNQNLYLVFELDEISSYILSRNCNFIIKSLPIYSEIYEKEYIEFLKKVKALIEDIRMNQLTINAFKDYWSRGLFSNLKYIFDSFRAIDFKDLLKNKPIIIVGAGPSLNKNVHLLKQIEGKVCIICAFSAAKVLQKNNIKPDFLTTIDSKQYGLSDFEANIPLVYIKEANTLLLKGIKSEKIISLIEDEIFFKEIFENKFKSDNIPVLGTVSTLSLGFARLLGASEIIMIGQDFCWTKEKIHADGTQHIKTEGYMSYHHYEMEEKDIYGNTVYTNLPFKAYKENFELISKLCKEENVKVIQATEGGLPIENTKILTLKEAIDKYCVNNFYDVNTIINSAYKNNNYICENDIEKQKIYNNIKVIYNNLKKLKIEVYSSLRLSKKLTKAIKYSYNDFNKINKFIIRLENLDLNLKKDKVIKSLIIIYMTNIDNYCNIEKTDNESLDFAIMNEKFYLELYKILNKLIRIAKEEMGYKD